jgi:Tfp pilus assembly protein PilV
MGPDIMIVVLITMLIGLIIILAVNRYQKKFLERKYQLAQEEL